MRHPKQQAEQKNTTVIGNCGKCGMEIQGPDWDTRYPFYTYIPKMKWAIFKHAWQYHRSDFPPQFTSLSQFLKWLRTPEGKGWDRKQGLIAEAERIVQGKK